MRPASMTGIEGANAQMNVPIANTNEAMMYAPRGPALVSNLADSAEPRMDAVTNSVVFQA